MSRVLFLFIRRFFMKQCFARLVMSDCCEPATILRRMARGTTEQVIVVPGRGHVIVSPSRRYDSRLKPVFIGFR